MRVATSEFPDYTFYPTDQLLAAFVEGPARLRRGVSGLDDDACRARPRGAARWSIQEIRRIAQRLKRRRINPAFIIAWSLWRRAHQAAAQEAHFKRKSRL